MNHEYLFFEKKGSTEEEMIETVCTIELPVDEVMRIKRNRLEPDEKKENQKRICIVTGIHGDELGGQYICYEIIRRIKAEFHLLNGIVDVYPGLNPLGIDAVKREVPPFELDLNTVFPGSNEDAMTEYAAAKLMEDLEGADVCIDVHSSNIFLRELPQVRIHSEEAEQLLPFAKKMNTPLVWIHPSSTVKKGSLAYALNHKGTKTLVVESGVALSINQQFCNQIIEGIFSVMHHLGIWAKESIERKEPVVAKEEDVVFVNGDCCGIFLPCVEHAGKVKKGQCIGRVLDTIMGAVAQEIIAPCDGILFTLREYPVVNEGSLLARILKTEERENE